MLFKLSAHVITEEIAQTVWNCVTATNEYNSKEYFLNGATAALDRLANISDPRARQIASDALNWAIAHPDEFSTFMPSKINRYSHAPNFVGFKSLLDGLDDLSTKWNRPVREIVHDEQSQFEKTLKLWHGLLSKPELTNEPPIYWPGEDTPIRFGKVAGSDFRIATDESSPGLQVVDVIIWLFKRTKDGKDIGNNCRRLMNRVLRNAYYNDFSFSGVNASLAPKIADLMSTEIPHEQMEAGRALSKEIEARRQRALLDHKDHE